MAVEDELIYEAVQQAIPDMTSRLFSSYCGMSDGYWGSVKAQDLELSTNALLHLAEMLECKREIGGGGVVANKVKVAHQLIADTIAKRTGRLNLQNEKVRQIVIKSIARIAYERDYTYNVPPITMGWL